MAGATLTYTPDRRFRRFLESLDGSQRLSVQGRILASIGRATEADVKTNQIVRGRGDAPPLRRQLSRRSGHLSSGTSTDETGLPRRVVVGTVVNYGPIHELGFSGTVNVRTHRRTKAFGRTIPGGFTVPGHSRRMRMPKRPFLRPAATKVLTKGEARRIFAFELARASR